MLKSTVISANGFFSVGDPQALPPRQPLTLDLDTWDVVGKVTFSQTIGYLEHGYDFDGTLGVAEQAVDYFAWVGCIPVLDHFIAKNAYIKGLGPPGFGNIGAMSVRRLVARYQGLDKDVHDPAQPDFLDKFIDAKNANPDTVVDDAQIVSWLMINLSKLFFPSPGLAVIYTLTGNQSLEPIPQPSASGAPSTSA
jgi:hypothetical protein